MKEAPLTMLILTRLMHIAADPPPVHTIPVYLSLGANMQPKTNLQKGIQALQQTFGGLVLSCVYRSKAVNLQGPDFLNMVVKLDCSLSLGELRQWILDTETQQGRRRDHTEQHGHPLDIDILLYGHLNDPTHNIPHRDIYTQAYVLKPLTEIAPTLTCPKTHQSMQQLWYRHDDWAETQIVDIAL